MREPFAYKGINLKVNPDDNNDMEFNPSTVFETTVPVNDPNLVFVPFVNKRHYGNKMKRVSGPNGYLMVPR